VFNVAIGIRDVWNYRFVYRISYLVGCNEQAGLRLDSRRSFPDFYGLFQRTRNSRGGIGHPYAIMHHFHAHLSLAKDFISPIRNCHYKQQIKNIVQTEDLAHELPFCYFEHLVVWSCHSDSWTLGNMIRSEWVCVCVMKGEQRPVSGRKVSEPYNDICNNSKLSLYPCLR